VICGSESPKISWSQKREHGLVVPLNLDLVELPGGYYASGKNLFLLILIYYVFHIQLLKSTDGNLPIIWKDVEKMVLSGTLPSEIY
jgi:hypothetical protein